jgi:uncharacterized protein YodC (DUF2158 family)
VAQFLKIIFMANQQIQFKVGDLVKLKSGSPVMTVTDVYSISSRITVKCSWFGGKKLETGQFPPDALTTATEKDSE